jgi:hypothetical protein
MQFDRLKITIANTPNNYTHNAIYNNPSLSKKVAKFWVKFGITKLEDLDRVYPQVLTEMLDKDFCVLWYLLSEWGRKPE